MPTLDLQVGASTDDCRVYWDSSAWVINLTDIVLRAGYYSAAYAKNGGGMRFTNVTIPQGATIDVAYLTLRCKAAADSNTVNSYIRAEDADNAVAFSDYANYSARPRVASPIAWDSIPAWTGGTWYNSPSIVSTIQAVINRAGWASGNALVIFWDDHDDRSTHTSYTSRTAYSYNGEAASAPKLHIEYTEGGGGWTHIAKVNGVASANLAKYNGIAKASIAKINGVAV